MMNQSRSAKSWPHERTSPRVPHDTGIIFKGRYGSNIEGKVRDVSEHGVYIVSKTQIAVGSDILLYLPIEVRAERTKMCIIAGKIVRLGGINEEFGFAVRFDKDISPAIKERIANFVSRKVPTTT